MTTDNLDLDDLRALLDAATPGPWFAGRFSIGAGRDHGDPDAIPVERVNGDADRDLIATLVNAAPALIAKARERDVLASQIAAWAVANPEQAAEVAAWTFLDSATQDGDAK